MSGCRSAVIGDGSQEMIAPTGERADVSIGGGTLCQGWINCTYKAIEHLHRNPCASAERYVWRISILVACNNGVNHPGVHATAISCDIRGAGQTAAGGTC